jgi:hypothetical protein
MNSYFLRQLIFLVVLGHQLLGDNFTSINTAGLRIRYLVTFCKTTLVEKDVTYSSLKT